MKKGRYAFRLAAPFAAAMFALVAQGEAAGIVPVSPAADAVEPLLAPAQRNYVLSPRATRDLYFADDRARRDELKAAGNRPRPVRLAWRGGEGREAVVEVVRADTREKVFSWRGVTNELDVLNLEIAREYEWRVTCGTESAGGTFRTEDLAPRFVRVENVANMRDLGGRIGLGGRRVRQGRIYRSAGWNANARWTYRKNAQGKLTREIDASVPPVPGTNYVTAAGRAYACGTLGIRSDIDLRTDRECHGMTDSPLGDGVSWFHHSYLGYYQTILPEGRKAFADVFRVLLDEKNYPVVFHCIGGADRTGTLAFILNALLGCDEEELFIDWEVTGFTGGITDSRHRKWFLGLVHTLGRQPGENWAEKASWYVRRCGFTDADIAKFREMMLEPKPSVSARPAWKDEWPDPDGGRRINNFVVELVDEPLKDGTIRFTLPRSGWVHVAVTGAEGATVTLDGGGENVCARRGDGRSESMRWMSLGRHELKVRGSTAGGRLTVRRVKTLLHGGLQFSRDDENLPAAPFTRAFHRRYVEGAFNTFGSGRHPGREESEETNRLNMAGCEFTSSVLIGPRDPVHEDEAAMRARFEAAHAADPKAIINVDEVGLSAPDGYNMNLGRTMREFTAAYPCVRIHTDLCDVINETIRRPEPVRDVIQATISSANGTGMICSEHYLLAQDTEERILRGINLAAAYAKSLRRVDPRAPRHNLYYIGAYLRPGDWTPHLSPAADMKAVIAKFLYTLATDARFREIGGTGVSRFWCDEEYARWACALVRYYAVDGGTEDMAAKLGYRCIPGHLANGDFLEGFSGWNAHPAEPATLAVTNMPGAGKKVFGRIAGRGGDAFALFTRSAVRPNTLSQKVFGLTPGRCYSLAYVTADYDEMVKPGVYVTNFVLAASISNARIIAEKSYTDFWPRRRRPSKRPASKAIVASHKLVFEAQAPEAEVVFSDWADGATPGGRIGERRVLNNVGVRPYFSEGETLK